MASGYRIDFRKLVSEAEQKNIDKLIRHASNYQGNELIAEILRIRTTDKAISQVRKDSQTSAQIARF